LLKILIKGDTFVDKYDVQQNDVPPKDWITKTIEDEKTEFKSSIQINVKRYDLGETKHEELKERTLVEEIVKTICGFGNANGGELIIGKRDDGTIFGLEYDMKLLKEANIDQLQNYLATMFRERIKNVGFVSKLKVYFDTVDEKTICLVKVPSRGKDPIFTSEQKFYVRIQTSTQNLSPQETNDYIKENFPSR
jgi:predicted HTH transcriptional regulator